MLHLKIPKLYRQFVPESQEVFLGCQAVEHFGFLAGRDFISQVGFQFEIVDDVVTVGQALGTLLRVEI